MIDYGARKTRTEVLRAEGRIRMIYRQAQKDIAKKLETFEKRHAARAEKYRQMVKDGKITQADYEAWMRGQVFQGEQWKAKKESIQQVLYNADNAALNVIDKGKLGVFTENANYVGYQLDHGARIDSGFNLYNEQAVARLIKDRPALLKKGVNKPKAFSWYNTLINNAVTQGIILGEGIPAIAKRIGETTGEQTKNAMVRNARTAMVSAQNGGRLEGLMQQKALGIDVKKRWHATFDARTRDAHGELDGQIKELEEPFTNSLGKLMFPGDPTGAAGNVYNCRCRMDGYYPEYDFGDVRRDNETGEVVGNVSYNEWKAMKQGKGEKQKQPETNDDYTQIAESFLQELAPWPSEYSSYDEYAKAKNNSNGDERFMDDSTWVLQRNETESAKRYDHTLAIMMEQYPLPSGERLAVGNYEQMVNRLSERQKQLTTHMEDMGVKGQLWHTQDGYVIGIRPSTSPANFDLNGKKSGSMFVGGLSPETTAVHEYGHIMQDYISRSQYTDGVDDVTGQVLTLWRDNKDEIKKQLSIYASENMNEMMAECFTQCVLYENPSEIAMEYGSLLTRASGGKIKFPYQRRR